MATFEEILGQSVNPRRKIADNIYNTNLKIIDDLISEIRRLNKAGKTAEAGRLIEIAQAVLDNNRAFRALVENLIKDYGSN